MQRFQNKLTTLILTCTLFIITGCVTAPDQSIPDTPDVEEDPNELKLYWFIPDGMRADPDLFNIYQWAQEGKLPNIKRLMDEGSYGYSVPVFPSHTPTNFATLLTGTLPKIHGVADGPMHTEGNPLSRVSVGGFRSVAKKVPPMWVTLEENDMEVFLQSMPGSTPPELEDGITVRGRWGGWGADFHALNFQTKGDLNDRKKQGRGSRLFFFGPQLTAYMDPVPARDWPVAPVSHSQALEIEMDGWGSTVYGYIYDSTDDTKINYDSIAFALDKGNILTSLSAGEWSDWQDITLKWTVQDDALDVPTQALFHVIKLDDDGFFRIRIFFSNINEHVVQPSQVAGEMIEGIGPMVDFVDNFPPQLIFYEEDKKTFLQEADLSLQWHRRAASFIINEYRPDVVIHDIYTPNQMLTSRWWLGYIDPKSERYNDVDEDERDELWEEVQWMYGQLDDIIGEVLDNKDENTIVVLSSDHGAVPLNKWVRLNNLFAKEGLLTFEIDPETGEPIIDWEKTKAIYLKMDNVYISPDGLAGDWERSSGAEYEALRDEVADMLLELTDENGQKPIAQVVTWEDVEGELDLPPDRTGDLVIANKAGYGWNEEMTEDLAIFEIPLKTGYKQAILPDDEKGMWTPFIIAGPGVKKNYFIEAPIAHMDQYPTLMTLLGMEIPKVTQGAVIEDVLSS